MMSFTRIRPSAALAAASLAFLAACSSDQAGGPTSAPQQDVALVVLGASSSYIVPGTPAGTFETFTADQVGRYAGEEFWDNLSDDGAINGTRGCAIGFYATDRMTDCNASFWEEPGSTANAAGNAFGHMWSDGVKAAAFTFNRASSYTVTFKGAYSRDDAYVGYYVKNGTSYDFTEVPAWTIKTLPAVPVVISAGTGTWGFFIANDNVVESSSCGVWKGKNIACSEAQGGQVMDPLQQFALFSNANGTAYLVGAEDRSVDIDLKNDSDYNDYIWTVVPTPCDFMTFGRSQIETRSGKVIISGNAGGVNTKGIMGNFQVEFGGTKYLVQDVTFYGPITSGALFGSQYPNARRIVGTAKSGETVEIRMYDGGEPGRVDDAVYIKVGSAEPLGAAGVDLNRGNVQYHAQCRGPGDE